MIIARMSRGKVEAAKLGRKTDGRYAYGAHPSRPEEAATLALIQRYRAQGFGANAITAALNKAGIKPRTAGKKWSSSTVRNILTRTEQRTTLPS
jgi:hypothetical protein